MSFRFGLTFLFGLLIVLMQEKVAHGAAGDLDEACLPGPPLACTDSKNVCDINQLPHKCRMKNGTDCTSGDKCVDGAACPTVAPKVCACDSQRNATTEGLCAVLLGGDCTGGKICTTGLICSSNQCKIRNGASCASHTNDCVHGATCNSTTNLCACGTGNTPATADGQCAVELGGDCTGGKICSTGLICSTSNHCSKVAIGGNCNGGKTCDTDLVCQGDACKILSGKSCSGHTGNCVDGATCNATSLCECGSGRTPALGDGKCSDAKSGTGSLKDLLSLVLVMAAFVMSRTV